MLRTAVVIGLASLYDTVEGSSNVQFALDADGCVVNYQEKCAAQDVHRPFAPPVCAPHHLLTLTGPVPARAQCRLLSARAPCDDGRGRHLARYRHQIR